jgi:hypothetical protein
MILASLMTSAYRFLGYMHGADVMSIGNGNGGEKQLSTALLVVAGQRRVCFKLLQE